MIEYKDRTEQELKSLAIDIFEGKVYTDRHIPKEEENGLMMVFMPLALGGGKDWTDDDWKTIGMIYEYIDQAGPRSINGMPSFFSFNMLSTEQATKVAKFYDEYRALKEGFLTQSTDGKDDQ